MSYSLGQEFVGYKLNYAEIFWFVYIVYNIFYTLKTRVHAFVEKNIYNNNILLKQVLEIYTVALAIILFKCCTFHMSL